MKQSSKQAWVRRSVEADYIADFLLYIGIDVEVMSPTRANDDVRKTNQLRAGGFGGRHLGSPLLAKHRKVS